MDLDEFISTMNLVRDSYNKLAFSNISDEEFYKLKNAVTEMKLSIVSMESSLSKINKSK